MQVIHFTRFDGADTMYTALTIQAGKLAPIGPETYETQDAAINAAVTFLKSDAAPKFATVYVSKQGDVVPGMMRRFMEFKVESGWEGRRVVYQMHGYTARQVA